MAKQISGRTPRRESKPTPNTSKLGKRLRELSDKALATGTEPLSLKEIHLLIAEARGRSV